jgi:serine-type D-Ala-D-Ala carboxypeptidase
VSDAGALDEADASAEAPIVVDEGMIETAAQGAIARGEVKGAVVVAVHGGRVVFQKAYGLSSVEPDERPMKLSTVFDLASLTKAIVTGPSVHLLAQQGKLALSDRVSRYLPSFARNGKERVTIEHLLLHTSGLVADNSLGDYKAGRASALAAIDALPLVTAPGERYAYSDVGFIVLGEIVEKVSGKSLDAFARESFFEPLGMMDTGFRPSVALASRAAPTEPRDGKMLVGEVHDPRAHLLGGVAGHAGLFSTGPDLARFVRMLLAHGKSGDREILAPSTLKRMTEPHELPGDARRTLGWDVRAGFTGGTGYGHTGFTARRSGSTRAPTRGWCCSRAAFTPTARAA